MSPTDREATEAAPLLGRRPQHQQRPPGPPSPLALACDQQHPPGPSSASSTPSSLSSSSSSSFSSSLSSPSPRHAPPSRAPGVARMDAMSSQLTTRDRVWLFFGIFLVGYAYGLESQVRSTYQPYATSSFSLHSYLSTINLLRSVIAIAVQPTAAKIADVFGRFEVVAVSTLCYVVGMAIESTASSVYAFCAGAAVYQIGYTSIVLLLEVLVADFSSMRARVFFSYVPALPFVINTWVSGTITKAVLSVTTWRWGIGMWCIIYPVASLPLLIALYTLDGRRERVLDGGVPKGFRDTAHFLGLAESRGNLFRQLDVVGLVGLVGALALILAPLTIVGGTAAHWRDPRIVAPLVAGLAIVPLFVLWERRGAATPLVPFGLLSDRGVWSALAVRSFLNFAWAVQGTYLYTVLVVAFDFSIESATRTLSLFSFFGVVSGVVIGMVVYRLRRLKFIIVLGTCLFMGGFAVLCNFPGGASLHSKAGIIGGQVLLGLASGFFAYPTQASIQASATRDHVAILTGLYLSFYNVGSAFGTCLAGAIWTQTLLPALHSNLAFQPNATLARAIYDSPFPVLERYPVGTEIREAVIASYRHVQWLLCLAGLVLCVPMIGFALALRNPKLSKRQVQQEALMAADEAAI
ncbi:major facilitator superfamily protein [Hirsutella rhossiliensis]|uniref:Major facilitator superfamily domain-containing protein n=1 Tax=Hirsutella rhossiliensis TaxID=111463 RepID=A0A9P8MQ37_9HYPO|nr:major facilitator superfamily domain-containing protein [Hirsutella rhossiliensis]KAH0960208.1 major facilitator superfamily domain-containing protein [Hirsutella rhossiliensis]